VVPDGPVVSSCTNVYSGYKQMNSVACQYDSLTKRLNVVQCNWNCCQTCTELLTETSQSSMRYNHSRISSQINTPLDHCKSKTRLSC